MQLWILQSLLVVVAVLTVTSGTDEEAEKLKVLQSKLALLEDELAGLKVGLHTRELEDEKLANFKRGLSPEDRDLVDRMKSKARFLKKALENDGQEPNGEIPPVDNTVSKRIAEDEELSSLSEDEKQLLREFPGKIDAVKAALQLPGATSEQDSAAAMVAKRVEQDSALRSLTAEQQALLAKFPSKMEAVETAMHEKGAPLSQDAQPAQGKREEDSPLTLTPEEHDVLMKLKLKLQDLKKSVSKKEKSTDCSERCGGDGKRCGGTIDKKAISSNCGDGKRCGGDTVERQVNPLDKVSRRFLSDMKFAQSNGLTLKDLLRALRAKKEALRETREEHELRSLQKKH